MPRGKPAWGKMDQLNYVLGWGRRGWEEELVSSEGGWAEALERLVFLDAMWGEEGCGKPLR